MAPLPQNQIELWENRIACPAINACEVREGSVHIRGDAGIEPIELSSKEPVEAVLVVIKEQLDCGLDILD